MNLKDKARETPLSEELITKKLREIRNQERTASPKVTERESIEISVKQLVSKGLSITEAIEYEANQARIKQLQEKMSCEPNTLRNQYKETKHHRHA